MRRFIHQDIGSIPQGSRIRSITRGKHVLRIAFPKGKRKKGGGRLVEILHPKSENPRLCRLARRNPAELVILGNPRAVTVDVSPEAANLFRDFHGTEPREVIGVQESVVIRNEYVSSGQLIELIVRAPSGIVQLQLERDGIKLACNPQGTQLYAIGGNQDISQSLGVFGTDTSKDFVELGKATKIVYRGRKVQDGGELNDYVHKFGDRGGRPRPAGSAHASVYPIVFFDCLRRHIYFVGGVYKIETVGIVG